MICGHGVPCVGKYFVHFRPRIGYGAFSFLPPPASTSTAGETATKTAEASA